MTHTITTTFNPASLPRWARGHEAVIRLAKKDLAFRCTVNCATTAQYRRILIRLAEDTR